jgi:hypothetical protein
MLDDAQNLQGSTIRHDLMIHPIDDPSELKPPELKQGSAGARPSNYKI